jgi:predicted Asp-tRNA(Asn)/Glu-tRNA(Gln) amidotransferase subunit C
MTKEDIQKEAEKVLKELSLALGDIDMPETYYVVDEINATRVSKKPTLDKKFIKQAKKNAPKMDEDGSFVMEIGRWVE